MKVLTKILSLYAVSRLIIFGFLYIGQSDQVHYVDNQLRLDNPLLDHFILYDSYNYAQIAVEGYSEDRLTAFFPLFPLIVRLLAGLTGMNVYWAGFVLSNFFFVCSLWLLYQLMKKKGLSERVRLLTLSALLFFPSSYFFSAFYTESFFLFLSLMAFRFWSNNRRAAAYFVGGLAALTRIVGVWIPLAFFIERWIRRKLDGKDVFYAFISSLMFAIYPLYLWMTKGDLIMFLKVEAPFYQRYSAFPFSSIYQDIVTSVERFNKMGSIEPIIVLHMILFLIFVCYLISAIRHRQIGMPVSWSEFIYTIGLVLMPLSSILRGSIPSHGFMRYYLTIFPLFVFLGKYADQALIRADKHSGLTYYAVWKAVNYLTLFMLICFSVYIFLILRFKGFVA